MRRSDPYGVAGPTADLEELAGYVAKHSIPLRQDADLDPLMDLIGDGRLALIGEASTAPTSFTSGGPGLASA